MTPRELCFFGGSGGGFMRILPEPRGGGSGTSISTLEFDSLDVASDEQDFNGDAGESAPEKSIGNDLSIDWVLLSDP